MHLDLNMHLTNLTTPTPSPCHFAVLHPPPPARTLRLQLVKLVCEGHSLLFAHILSYSVEDFLVFLLELLEPVVQFFMPGIENKNLEAKCRGGDHKVGQGNSAGYFHVCIDAGRIVVSSATE